MSATTRGEPGGQPSAIGSSIPGLIPRLVAAGAVIVIVAAASAYLIGGRGQPRYGARADIVYRHPTSVTADAAQRASATQRELMQSKEVLGTAARLAGESFDAFSKRVAVGIAQSDIMRLTVTSSSRARGVAWARSIVEQYERLVEQFAEAQRAQRAGVLPQKIHEVGVALATAKLKLKRVADDTPLAADLRSLAQRLSSRLARLRDQSIALASASPQPSVAVVTEPYSLPQQLSPRPRRAVVVGIVSGLLIAAGLSLVVLRRREPGARSHGDTEL